MVLRDSILSRMVAPMPSMSLRGGAQEGGRGWVSQLEVGGCGQKGVCGSGVIADDHRLSMVQRKTKLLATLFH